ncbi:ulp1 protease family, C-terminal catalytic domain-containing protein [Tanacetum coccineum]
MEMKEVKKYVALKLKMADIYLHEADICLKDAIKENPDDVDLKVFLKVRNEMCHELESNECTTPKDNMDGSKKAKNANGNPEGDMLSSTQMYGTPTELIRLSNQVMRSRESDQQMLFDGIRIASGAIDVFTHVLNYAEKFRDPILTEYDVCQYADKQSEKMLCEDRDAKYKSDLFIQNMSNVLRETLYQKLKMVDLVFFPIIKGEHFYVICMNLKITEILILDNINSDEQDLVKRYGQILRVLTKLFEDYLSFEKHHRKGEMKFAEYKILRMGTEDKAQNFLLNDLQYKYVSKMLLCEINIKKEEVEIETEAYKLMERMEKIF